MSQFEPENVIRITAADAASPHVDDLLNRQAALRGETGMGGRRKRKWYYSNWFVFMLAGTLAALFAWGLLEPYFNDLLYVQGKIEEVQVAVPELPGQLIDPAGHDISAKLGGIATINGDPVWFTAYARPLNDPEADEPFDLKSLKPGQEVGVYVEYNEPLRGEAIALARFVDTDPPPGHPATRRLSQLDAAQTAVALLMFPVVAAMVGLAIGSADGLVCRLWRRMLLAGIVGLVVGFLGGFLSQFLAGLVYTPLNMLAMKQSGEGIANLTAMGFFIQMCGRSLAWGMAGMAMGLGQGIALRSGRLLLYGFLGGAIGGLLGGLLFDPIDLILLGVDKPSAHVSRLIGFAVIGATVGLMIGVVELLARDAWLHMVAGPLAGKEFLIFKDRLQVGSSPRSDIYLFNDADVAERHAVIRAAADQYEIEAADQFHPVLVNGRAVTRTRLRHGDQITLGRTVFAFQRRRTD